MENCQTSLWTTVSERDGVSCSRSGITRVFWVKSNREGYGPIRLQLREQGALVRGSHIYLELGGMFDDLGGITIEDYNIFAPKVIILSSLRPAAGVASLIASFFPDNEG